MTSFRSKHFPDNKNRFFIQQENAMQYYAVFTLIVMVGVMLKISTGETGLVFLVVAIVAELLAMGLANMLSFAKLSRSYAQIFFVDDHFSLLSVYDILYKEEHKVFPIKYANPTRQQDMISFHFNDMIITLNREDWEDFDLIWERFHHSPSPATPPTGWTSRLT